MQDLHTIDLEDFKYGGTNITSLRLVDPSNAALQDLIHTWETLDGADLGTGEVAGYTSLGSLQDIFEAAGRFPPQSSPILPSDFGRQGHNQGGSGSEKKQSVEVTEASPVNVSAMSVSGASLLLALYRIHKLHTQVTLSY